MRKAIEMCKVAPSRISDVRLCFAVLCGEPDWSPPLNPIPMETIPKRSCTISLMDTIKAFSHFMRESTSELGLYPRVATILTELVKIYKDLAPAGVKVVIHPEMSFDKTTDYAVIVVSAVSF